jgi:hypothetical protein
MNISEISLQVISILQNLSESACSETVQALVYLPSFSTSKEKDERPPASSGLEPCSIASGDDSLHILRKQDPQKSHQDFTYEGDSHRVRKLNRLSASDEVQELGPNEHHSDGRPRGFPRPSITVTVRPGFTASSVFP